jgi:hypothetical protein
MSTGKRSEKWPRFAATMSLGLVLALGIAFVGGQPQAAWLGFALAAMYAETARGRAALTLSTGRPGG